MPSDQRRISRIFEQVVDLSDADRGPFLDRACAGDEALRSSIERLLKADAEAGDFLEKPLLRVGSGGAFRPPERIGPYRLLEKIGEGGMGMVFRAIRDDEAFRREVAVKLIVHGAISRDARRRLRVERQILAALNHPWIAQIFDGGTTDQGMPYLVMEYIDGEPIDRYCEAKGLGLRQRIELFRKICAAVHCSHQNLVVHCDLKPSNILITATGEPKLLDFGIAKLLGRDVSAGRDEPATLDSRPLTPEYASPEQLRGEALSTVSDVYSLGVLLHKLLTGRRPEPSAGQREDAGEARSPSRLRGDLAAIVLKALRDEPHQRFGSAEQFGEDLERYLQGFPVLARQGSFRYRAKKFLRRHRGAVTAAVAGVTLLGAFAFSMATLAGRLSQERETLQEVVGFFRLFFERAGPLVDQGRNLTLREAVDQNAEMIEGGLKDQPAAKVQIAAVLGDIYRELGQPEPALLWSERALTLNRRLAGEESAAYALSSIQVGAALRELGRYEDAETRTRAGLRWLQSRSDTEPSALVAALNKWVILQCYRERYREADDDSAKALRLAEAELDSTSLETRVAIANRGLVLRQLGHTAEAQNLYERAIGLYRHNLGGSHPHVATLLLNLSSIQRDRGDLATAQRTLEEVDRQYLEMFGDGHYKRVLPLVGLATLASQQQHIDKALAFYREAIDVAISSDSPPEYVLRATLDLARLLLAEDRCQEGEPWLEESLAHCQAQAADSWRYAEIEGLLGECQARRQTALPRHR